VKFSFHRTKGAKILKEKVKDVVVVDPHRVRFQLAEPFPDFMAFYGTLVTGAGWIVPKKYVEKVGDDGFKKHPIGLGPYRFISHQPGVELVMEAYEGYWRKMPSVKRLVFKSVPESSTRVAMLKKGEVDVAYLLEAPQALEVKRDPALKLAFSGGIGIAAIDFLDMWDPKSPWHDKRVRLAASYAIDRVALSDAETLGASKPTGSFIPRAFEFALPIEPHPYNPNRAKQLLAEAGYPNGFDAGDLHVTPPYSSRARRSWRTWAPWGSGRACGPWSARRSSRPGRPRSSGACASAAVDCTATPPPGCPRRYRATGPTPTAAGPMSMRSSSSRRWRRTAASAPPC
jgi:peptide/nickel transport system substrate-binding protein